MVSQPEDMELTFIQTGQKNEESFGTELRLLKVTVNGQEIPWNKFKNVEGWSLDGDLLVSYDPDAQALAKITLSDVATIKVDYIKQRGSGYLIIQSNGEQIAELDLYSDSDWEECTWNYQPPKQFIPRFDIFMELVLLVYILIILICKYKIIPYKSDNVDHSHRLPKEKNSKTLWYSCFLITFLSILGSITIYTTQVKTIRFDDFSEGIMISDMLYGDHYNYNSNFLMAINGELTFSDDSKGTLEEIEQHYKGGTTYNQDDYSIYNSNLTFHRYFYRLINKIISTKSRVLYLLKGINAFLMAIMLTVIVYWIYKNNGKASAIILYTILVFFSPSLCMYGTNLYWVGWSLFLPMVSSICTVEFIKLKKTVNYPNMYFIAFSATLLKQLFYFEFISTIMVSLMIPYIYYVLTEKVDIKKSIKIFLVPALGAISSFIAASFIKLLLLTKEYNSFSRALNAYWEPIIKRLIGDTNSSNMLVRSSTEIGQLDVLRIMGQYPAISINKLGTISEVCVCLIFIFTILLLFIFRRDKRYLKEMIPLGICTVISLAGPFSWFILAKPHTMVHSYICTILWFIPFNILAFTFIGKIVVYMWNRRKYFKFKQCLRLDFSLIALFLILLYIGNMGLKYYDVTQKLSVIDKNGILCAQNDFFKMYLYEDSFYYYIDNKKIPDNGFIYMHIYPDNTQNKDFLNRDINLEDIQEKTVLPFKKKALIQRPIPDYKFEYIMTGISSKVADNQYKEYSQNTIYSNDIYTNNIYSITAFNLTDENWVNGISQNGNCILLNGNLSDYINLTGKTIQLLSGEKVQIIDVKKVDDNWLYIFLDKKISNQNGYPVQLIISP